MGWEYAIVLKNEEYHTTLQALHGALVMEHPAYEIQLHENEICVLGDDKKWPDILSIKIETARHIQHIIPDGHLYFYCLFHLGGQEAFKFRLCIENCLKTHGAQYLMEER